MKIVEAVVSVYCDVLDAPAVHGAHLGYAGQGLPVKVILEKPDEPGEYGSPHDGWVQISDPDPWYYNTKTGWIKMNKLIFGSGEEHEYRIITDASTGAIKSSTQVR